MSTMQEQYSTVSTPRADTSSDGVLPVSFTKPWSRKLCRKSLLEAVVSGTYDSASLAEDFARYIQRISVYTQGAEPLCLEVGSSELALALFQPVISQQQRKHSSLTPETHHPEQASSKTVSVAEVIAHAEQTRTRMIEELHEEAQALAAYWQSLLADEP